MFSKIYLMLVLVSYIKYSCSVSIRSFKLRNPSDLAKQNEHSLNDDQYIQLNTIPRQYYDYQDQYQHYPAYAKPYFHKHITNNPYIRPKPNLYYSNPYYQQSGGQNIRQNIIDVLYSISKNDDLHCVPKILCEITSGTMYGRQNGNNLPININLESLTGFLSSFNGLQSSPLLNFGRAALLGYTSNGTSRSCIQAYPECPSDPDKLVQYLNNHNGGFFRYFNGIFPQNYAPSYQNFHMNYPQPPYFRQKEVLEKRIQNVPVNYISTNSIRQNQGFIFPREELDFYKNPNVALYSNHDLKFPEDIKHIRRPKTLYNENINFEKPLPNHKASPIIFPDRTGTGELIVDSGDFDKNTIYNTKTEYNNNNDISNIRNYYFNLNKFKSGRQLFFPEY